jgi:peptidoglycan/LPS O-acetylase OafA/YrhL
MERHYGMDWLRIGAFALLILYHIGMVFAPWGFYVNTAHPQLWVEIPMFLTNPWRLTLLFVISGYASRALFLRAPSTTAFVAERSARLLPALLFGMVVLVPPQAWVDLTIHGGAPGGFLPFLHQHYFRFERFGGLVLPGWNHLWFVAYLFVYTLALAPIGRLPGGGWAQRLFDRAFGGWRALILPAAYFVLLEAVVFWQHEDDTHDLLFDGVAHLRYVPAFLFGFGLARSRPVMAAMVRQRWIAAGLALGCFATIATLLILYPNFTFPSYATTRLYQYARRLETWTAIVALIGFAERHWNRDHRWRATLAEATFPFYMIHQTLIIVVEYGLLQLALPPLAEFVLLVAATVTGCWSFYLIGREIGWLRPLIGLKRLTPPSPLAKGAVHELDVDDSWWGGVDAARRPA